MTIEGAIVDLQNLIADEGIPFWAKPCLQKIKETVEAERERYIEERKTDDLIVLQFDCLVGRDEFLAIRNQVVDQVEEGVVLLPNYMHVAYIGSKCNVEVMYEGEGGSKEE